jgi:hypothetical protein
MVIHILKDGTRLEDISGHIVRIQEAETVYKLMDSINSGRLKDETKKSDRDN